MIKDVFEFIQKTELLPGRGAKLTAGATSLLLLALTNSPMLATAQGSEMNRLKTLIIRERLIFCLLFLGMLLIHFFVVRYKNSLIASQPWKVSKKIVLAIGEKFDVIDSEGNKVFRITLKDISKQLMPLPYTVIGKGINKQIEAETVTLSFEDFMSIIPGQAVKAIQVSMPFVESSFVFSKNSNAEEANSVFSFSTIGQEQFFRCFVDHINILKQEAEIDIYFLKQKSKQQQITLASEAA